MLDDEPKRGRKYDDVVNGAKEVFLAQGFEGASMDEIARAAGVSKATLYSYFPDKKAMYMAVARTKYFHQIEVAQAEMDSDLPVEACLRFAAQKLVFESLTPFSRDVFRLAAGEAARFPDIARECYEAGPAAIKKAILPVLEDGVTKGELTIENLDFAAEQFMELCKVDLFNKYVCGARDSFTDAEKNLVLEEALRMFMARYASKL